MRLGVERCPHISISFTRYPCSSLKLSSLMPCDFAFNASFVTLRPSLPPRWRGRRVFSVFIVKKISIKKIKSTNLKWNVKWREWAHCEQIWRVYRYQQAHWPERIFKVSMWIIYVYSWSNYIPEFSNLFLVFFLRFSESRKPPRRFSLLMCEALFPNNYQIKLQTFSSS